jgi:hypothetical protein
VLRKDSRNSSADDVSDVPADNPVGTLHRFNDGLRRVLAVPRVKASTRKKKAKKTKKKR